MKQILIVIGCLFLFGCEKEKVVMSNDEHGSNAIDFKVTDTPQITYKYRVWFMQNGKISKPTVFRNFNGNADIGNMILICTMQIQKTNVIYLNIECIPEEVE